MGLSIYYRGSFNKNSSLSKMIEEVKDIAEIYKWPYYIFEKEFPAGSFHTSTHNDELYGISFTPPGCETVSLCFLSNGRMSGPLELQLYGNSRDKKEQEYLYMLSVKTQYAGEQIHKLIIHLLRHVSNTYLVDFFLKDEGEYWETGDEKLLEQNFKLYNRLLNIVGDTFENNPLMPGESFDEYFERVLKQIRY